METKKDIGSAIKNQLESLHAAPSDKVWKLLESDLQKKKRGRALPFWLWYAGIGVLAIGILIGGSFHYLSSTPDSFPVENKISSSNKNSSSEVQDEQIELQKNASLLNNDSNTNDALLNDEHQAKGVLNSTDSKQDKEDRNSIAKESNLIAKEPFELASNFNPQKNKNNSADDFPLEFEKEEQKSVINSHAVEKMLIDKDTLSSKITDLDKSPKQLKEENLTLSNDSTSLPLKRNPWSASVSGIVNFYDNFKNGSLIDRNFDGNQVDRKVHLNYGLALHYNLNTEWTLRIGANLIKYDQTTRRADSTAIDFENLEYVRYTTEVSEINSFVNNSETIDITQNFTYLEIPLQMRYSFYGEEVDFGVIGGLQSRILLTDNIILDSDTRQLKIGESSTIYDIGVSAHFSLASRIKLYKKFYFNIEPSIYYHLKPYETDRINSPSEFRFTSSLEYKF